MPLDPATRDFLERAARKATKPRHMMSVAEARAAMALLGDILQPGPALWRVEDLVVPVTGAELPTRLYVPVEPPGGLLVYFHGGGWAVGTLAEFDPLCRELAARSKCAIAAVAYRLAPEHSFPGPVDDAWTSLQWLTPRCAALLGCDVPVLVGGDSAGANLAIATSIRARDRGTVALAGQLLIYPVADCDFTRPSYQDPANQLMLTRETMQYYWNHYVPDEAARLQPEASPVRAADHSRLPPAIVLTAEYDVLRDEGEAYAALLRGAGVRVVHRRFEGQMHAFLMMVGVLPGAEIGLEFAASALRALIAGDAK